jgi:hypothetical protein
VRITTFVRRLLTVKQVRVLGARLRQGEVEIEVRPSWREPRCGSCGRRAAGYDRRPARRWRHVPWGAAAVWLRYAPRRVQCRRCGVGTERVAWAGSTTTRFTEALEELGAYLATVMDQTAVTRLLGISWAAVGEIVERVVARKLDPKRLDGIRRIGVDEFSYRKRHRYLTLVVDHDRQRVVWAVVGRGHEALASFFEALGAERLAQLELATIDLAGGYLKAFRERAPHVTIVFDPDLVIVWVGLNNPRNATETADRSALRRVLMRSRLFRLAVVAWEKGPPPALTREQRQVAESSAREPLARHEVALPWPDALRSLDRDFARIAGVAREQRLRSNANAFIRATRERPAAPCGSHSRASIGRSGAAHRRIGSRGPGRVHMPPAPASPVRSPFLSGIFVDVHARHPTPFSSKSSAGSVRLRRAR